MDTRKTRGLPARLERLQQRFEHSRRTGKARSHIPSRLWAAAVTMATTYGVNRTARALRLDYYSLKKRVEQAVGADHGFAVAPAPHRGALQGSDGGCREGYYQDS